MCAYITNPKLPLTNCDITFLTILLNKSDIKHNIGSTHVKIMQNIWGYENGLFLPEFLLS